MPTPSSPSSLQEQTITALKQVIDRGLTHFAGLEEMMIRQVIRRIYPRLEAKIHETSDGELQDEIRYLHQVISPLLPAPPPRPKRKVKAKKTSKKRRT